MVHKQQHRVKSTCRSQRRRFELVLLHLPPKPRRGGNVYKRGNTIAALAGRVIPPSPFQFDVRRWTLVSGCPLSCRAKAFGVRRWALDVGRSALIRKNSLSVCCVISDQRGSRYLFRSSRFFHPSPITVHNYGDNPSVTDSIRGRVLDCLLAKAFEDWALSVGRSLLSARPPAKF